MEAAAARGLTKRFGDVTAVDEVTLTVGAGRVHGLLGANGAGKTTLLRLLFGLISPDVGSIELLGSPLGGAGSAALDGVGGFVEDPAFYPYLSASANLALLQRLDGGRPSTARVHEVLSRVGLSTRRRDRVGGYSTGMRQRLGIAAALLRRPRLLLLDEPTSGLDPAGSRAVAALIRELAADGVAVLLSSHRIGELERICEVYTFLDRGRVVWDGSAVELTGAAPATAYALQTSDDPRAFALATGDPDVEVTAAATPSGFVIAADQPALDGFVLALGRASIAVRRLEMVASPLESMFFALCGERSQSALDAPAVAA